MMAFSEQFQEHDSFEIEYNGKKVNAFYRFDKKGNYKFSFSLVNTNSLFEQAIVIHLDEFEGNIFIEGEKVKRPKGRFPQLIFAEKTTPIKFDMDIALENGSIVIANGSFDPKAEVYRNLNGGCAIIIEKIKDNILRFHCNDYENDDDFDDLIFDLEITKME